MHGIRAGVVGAVGLHDRRVRRATGMDGQIRGQRAGDSVGAGSLLGMRRDVDYVRAPACRLLKQWLRHPFHQPHGGRRIARLGGGVLRQGLQRLVVAPQRGRRGRGGGQCFRPGPCLVRKVDVGVVRVEAAAVGDALDLAGVEGDVRTFSSGRAYSQIFSYRANWSMSSADSAAPSIGILAPASFLDGVVEFTSPWPPALGLTGLDSLPGSAAKAACCPVAGDVGFAPVCLGVAGLVLGGACGILRSAAGSRRVLHTRRTRRVGGVAVNPLPADRCAPPGQLGAVEHAAVAARREHSASMRPRLWSRGIGPLATGDPCCSFAAECERSARETIVSCNSSRGEATTPRKALVVKEQPAASGGRVSRHHHSARVGPARPA